MLFYGNIIDVVTNKYNCKRNFGVLRMTKKLNQKTDKFEGKQPDKQNEANQKQSAEKPQEEFSINYKELYLRSNADFQNYKRRVEIERLSWMNDAQASILLTILPLLDDLSRAIDACDDSEEKHTWLEGLLLIQKKITKTIEDLGVKEIDCSGEFDPEYHEALIQVESEDYDSGKIVEVMSKGYLFKDNVLRHAKVSVAK